MTLFAAAALLLAFPIHPNVPVSQIAPAPATADAPSAVSAEVLAKIIKGIEDRCYVVDDKPITILFLGDDGTWQIGDDCFAAFKAWKQMPVPRPLPVA